MVPSADSILFTICGRKRVPLFAKADAACTICNAVTEISWPIAIVGLERADQVSTSLRIP